MSAEQARVPTLPSPALLRAVVVGALPAVLALLLGRVELLLISLPLLAWALLAVVRRLARGEGEGMREVRVLSSNPSIAEGGTVRIAVESPEPALLGLTVPLPAHASLTPPLGSQLDADRVRLRLTARRWGRYEVGPLHLALSDPMGAFRAQQHLKPLQLQVTPDSSLLEAPPNLPTPIGVAGVHLSARRGQGTALADVRPFQPGDRLHRINWRVTSRTGTLHTNATFAERDTDVLLVADTLQDVFAPGLEASAVSSLDITVRAISAISRHYLGIGDRVGLHDLGPRIGAVRAGSGPRQLRVLIETLARAERSTTGVPRIRRIGAVRGSTLVVVCTPLLDDRVVAQIGEVLARGADVIVVDTLPADVGDAAALGGRRAPGARRGDPQRYWPEAWTLRRLLRESTVRALHEQGVPVTPWEGPGSLAPVLLSLSRAASAPRMRRSRCAAPSNPSPSCWPTSATSPAPSGRCGSWPLSSSSRRSCSPSAGPPSPAPWRR
jgi:uncharacterized protein (DUF58 family)